MSIKYAILGFLSWHPLSGYDLKKIIEGSPSLYWSGNNNQIYRTLIELHEAGQVTCEVQQQEHYPPRKVYAITDTGLAALREWLLSGPEPPQVRSTFLIQLTWADRLAPDELEPLLARYEHAVEMQWLMSREEERRGEAGPGPAPVAGRTPREARLWRALAAHNTEFFANELAWVRKLRAELSAETPGGSGAGSEM